MLYPCPKLISDCTCLSLYPSRAVAAYEREQREIQKRTDLDATELHNYIHGHCAQEKYKWMDIQTDSEHKLHEEKGNGGMEFNESSAIDYQDNNALVPYDGSGEQYQQQVNYPQQQDHTQLHYEPQSQSWQMNGHECGEIYNSYGQRVGNYSNTYSSRENYQGY